MSASPQGPTDTESTPASVSSSGQFGTSPRFGHAALVDSALAPTDLSDRLRIPADPWLQLRDDAVFDSYVDRRAEQMWTQTQDREAATFAGSFIHGAETGATAVVTTIDAGTVIGAVDAVGSDFVLISEPGGSVTALRLSRVVAVEFDNAATNPPDLTRHCSGGFKAAADDRTSGSLRFHELLRLYAAQRRPVSIGTASQHDAFVGRLWSCGSDVCTLRRDGQRPRALHIRLDAVSYVHIWSELR